MYQSTSSPFRQSAAYPAQPQPANQPNQPENNTFYSNQQSFAGPQFGGGSNSWAHSNSPAKAYPNQSAYGQNNSAYGSTSAQSSYHPQHSTAPHHPSLGLSSNGNQSFTNEPSRHYLPGYLSGGALAQSHATPPQSGHDDSRTWDSPASRASVSASPVSRFGGQSLFGPRDGTPSRSPKAGLFSRELPKAGTSRVVEMDEDAPPVESLGEMDANDSMSLSPGKPTRNDSYSMHSSQSVPPPQTISPSLVPAALPASSQRGNSINVFGFPSNALSLVISHFSQFGEILSTTPNAEGGNWITITYAQSWSAQRAARRNGEILAGNVMVGVKLVDDDGAGATASPNLASTNGNGGNANGNGNGNPLAATHRPATTNGTSTPSGIGRPVQIINCSAFKQPTSTPTRLGFFNPGSNNAGTVGTPAKVQDPHASLFAAESNRQTTGMPPPASQGVMGKVSDLIFGW